MRFSFVILTYIRRDDLLRTLAQLHAPGQLPTPFETIVVDNASTDGTAEAVASKFSQVRLIRRDSNEGSVARNAGVEAARSPYIVLLDDDSYPLGDTVTRSLAYLEAHPRTALVGGKVILPDGSEDAAALPIVMPACAMCLRREAFQAIDGFAPEFFRQAEEYDLIFRLLAAGWEVERFEDLTYRHEKVPRSRNHALIHKMDLRNNLILLQKHIPKPLRAQYRHDWLRRYAALARHDGHEGAIREGVAEARAWITEQGARAARSLKMELIERVLGLNAQARAVKQWAEQNRLGRVVIADYSKNLYATWRACEAAGLQVLGIADGNAALAGMNYRGFPILPDAEALQTRPDGIVLSNINPAQIERRLASLSRQFTGPLLRLWHPQLLTQPASG